MTDADDEEQERRPMTSAERLAHLRRGAGATERGDAEPGRRQDATAAGEADAAAGPTRRRRPEAAERPPRGPNPARTGVNPAVSGGAPPAGRPRPAGPARRRRPDDGEATAAVPAPGQDGPAPSNGPADHRLEPGVRARRSRPQPATAAATPAAAGVGGDGVQVRRVEAIPGASVFLELPPDAPPVTAVDLAQAAYDANPRNWTTIRRRTGPTVRLLAVLAVVLVLVVGAARFIDGWVQRQIHPTGDPGDEVTFVVEEGWTTNDIASELADAGVVGNAAIFRQYMSCPGALRWLLDCPTGEDYSFQAGQYVLAESMDYDVVLETLAAGPVVPSSEELVLVTVREGLTLGEISDDLLGQLPAFDGEELLAAYLSPELRWGLMPEDQILVEGLLFPETYAVDEVGEQDELGLLRRMREEFDAVVAELDIEARASALGITPYEAVIIASLIEEEAKIDADRARISQVIHNRLAAGWSLGVDATTRYAVGKPPGEPLTQEDLASDSPYNTRNPNVIGLPPTPIAAPGRASLEAALNPESGPWMYYVLTDEGGVEGAHRFVETEAEFAEAVEVCRDLGYCG